MRQIAFDRVTIVEELKAFAEGAGPPEAIQDAVKGILADVRERGDAAVFERTEAIDGVAISAGTIRVERAELQSAVGSLTEQDIAAINGAIECVLEFNARGVPRSWEAVNPHGAHVGERHYPIERVGIWIPGGTVPLVSTVVMTTQLAKIAGCEEIAVCTPPHPEGVNQALLATLHLCGISEVYAVGGVMAIGAMAYGTASIPAVDKVFGPGNAYVTEAKRQVFGTVGVDLLPGPSEVMVIADETANPAYVAADLLAQAEHGSGKERIYLVTSDKSLPGKVSAELESQRPLLSHAAAIKPVLDGSFACVAVSGFDEAAEVANLVAPEHLELHVREDDQERALELITTAGAILVGENTPTVLGDFTAGPSHTLPTNRTGRFFSGLRVADFMRRTSFVRYEKEHLTKAAPIVAAFSALESLDAHGKSLAMRLDG